ncbi:hypothetical protein [Streptomyces sp. NPDC002516]
MPEEHHFGGPAAEIGQSLVYAGTVHDGTVRWHTELTIDGTPTTALSLAVTPHGNLLVGTVDGRILEYAVRP